jgi:hypothetical protein
VKDKHNRDFIMTELAETQPPFLDFLSSGKGYLGLAMEHQSGFRVHSQSLVLDLAFASCVCSPVFPRDCKSQYLHCGDDGHTGSPAAAVPYQTGDISTQTTT